MGNSSSSQKLKADKHRQSEKGDKTPAASALWDRWHLRFDEAGVLREKDDGKFNYDAYRGDLQANKERYEEIGKLIDDFVYELLESFGKLHRYPLRGNSTFIFVSDNWLDNCDRLLVLIHGSGEIRAGQWSKRLITSEGLESGTQLPYIEKAHARGWGVIVLNTNDNLNSEGSESPFEHSKFVWKHVVLNSQAQKVAIVANSAGGSVTASLVSEYFDDFKERVCAIALTDSLGTPKGSDARKYFERVACNWVTGIQHVGSPIQGEGVPKVSAGTTTHEETSHCARDDIIRFIEMRFGPSNPGTTDYKRGDVMNNFYNGYDESDQWSMKPVTSKSRKITPAQPSSSLRGECGASDSDRQERSSRSPVSQQSTSPSPGKKAKAALKANTLSDDETEVSDCISEMAKKGREKLLDEEQSYGSTVSVTLKSQQITPAQPSLSLRGECGASGSERSKGIGTHLILSKAEKKRQTAANRELDTNVEDADCSDYDDETYFEMIDLKCDCVDCVSEACVCGLIYNSQEIKPKAVESSSLLKLYKDMQESDEGQAYSTTRRRNGKVGRYLIINLDEDRREGSEYDYDNLENLLKELDFEASDYQGVSCHDNKEEDEADLKEVIMEIEKQFKKINYTEDSCTDLLRQLNQTVLECQSYLKQSGEAVPGQKADLQKKLDILGKQTSYSQLKKRYQTYQEIIRHVDYEQHKYGRKNMLRQLEAEISLSKSDPDYGAYKMFVLVVMGHGRDDYIDGPNGKIKMTDIYRKMAPDQFPAMKGKPKWVIFQTCSGDDIAATVQSDDCNTLRYVKNDVCSPDINSQPSAKPAFPQPEQTSQADVDWRKMHVTCDDLYVWLSCFPSYKAHRESHGSWFVRTLIDVIHKHSHHMHLEQLFERVKEKLRAYSIKRDSKRQENRKRGAQIPYSINTLTKARRIYLFPRIKDSLEKQKEALSKSD